MANMFIEEGGFEGVTTTAPPPPKILIVHLNRASKEEGRKKKERRKENKGKKEALPQNLSRLGPVRPHVVFSSNNCWLILLTSGIREFKSENFPSKFVIFLCILLQVHDVLRDRTIIKLRRMIGVIAYKLPNAHRRHDSCVMCQRFFLIFRCL